MALIRDADLRAALASTTALVADSQEPPILSFSTEALALLGRHEDVRRALLQPFGSAAPSSSTLREILSDEELLAVVAAKLRWWRLTLIANQQVAEHVEAVLSIIEANLQ